MRPPLSSAGRMPVFVKRTWTVLAPWSSLTSYSGRSVSYYGMVCYIILHNIIRHGSRLTGHGHLYDTNLNIIWPRYGGKKVIASKKTHHPYIDHIRWAVCSIVSMRPPLSRAGRIPVFVKRTRTVLAPWCSLTSYSGRICALLYYLI